MSCFSQDNEIAVVPISDEEVARIQEYQYALKLNKVINNSCHYIIYENKNNSHFSIIKLEKSEVNDSQFFSFNRNAYIKRNGTRYKYKEMFGGITKNHIFSIKEGKLIAKYKIYRDSAYISEEMILTENLNCN
jgi:hypothetical protein